MKSNPNGANQYKVDPRQALFLSLYFDPKSKTFSNGLQSALTAGFSEEYAKVMIAHMPTWLSEKVKHSYIIEKAEENIKEFIEMKTEDTGKMKIKADITKFTLERLKRKEYGKAEEDKPLTGNVTVNIIDFENFLKLKNGTTETSQRNPQGPEMVQGLQRTDIIEGDTSEPSSNGEV